METQQIKKTTTYELFMAKLLIAIVLGGTTLIAIAAFIENYSNF